jgi:hypothetical protein
MIILPVLSLLLASGAIAADMPCTVPAALARVAYSLEYEHAAGSYRTATLDRSDCRYAAVTRPGDFFEDSREATAVVVRFWSERSPFEVHAEISEGRAELSLRRRRGALLDSLVPRLESLPEDELPYTSVEFHGEVFEPELRTREESRGLRRTRRAARIVLRPFSR